MNKLQDHTRPYSFTVPRMLCAMVQSTEAKGREKPTSKGEEKKQITLWNCCDAKGLACRPRETRAVIAC